MKPFNAWKINPPAFKKPVAIVSVSRFFNSEYNKSHDSKVKAVLGNANDINHGM